MRSVGLGCPGLATHNATGDLRTVQAFRALRPEVTLATRGRGARRAEGDEDRVAVAVPTLGQSRRREFAIVMSSLIDVETTGLRPGGRDRGHR